MSVKTPDPVDPARELNPTVREMRATLTRLYHEIENVGRGTQSGKLFERAYDHMAWLLDAYLFDVDSWQDDGGRS